MRQQQVLIIGSVWVEPNSSAAGKRMLQLITQFIERGYEVTFVSAAQKSEKAVDLISMGVHESFIELNNISFDHCILTIESKGQKYQITDYGNKMPSVLHLQAKVWPN